LAGTNGDTGELRLKESDTKKSKFERDGTDVFTFNDKLTIGELQKLRIWHDNKGFSSGILLIICLSRGFQVLF